MISSYYSLFVLGLSIFLIVLLTARFRINAFFALLIVTLLTGFLIGTSPVEVVQIMKSSLGNTLGKIGLVILLGMLLGTILEKTKATLSIAYYILRRTGVQQAPLAIALVGFLVGLPIFCDAAFVVLSSLNKSVVQRAKLSMPMMATILGSALYAVHCLVPPHPGILAATEQMHLSLGAILIGGILLAIPTVFVAFLWARHFDNGQTAPTILAATTEIEKTPSIVRAIIPILVPILLIAMQVFVPLWLTPASESTRLAQSLLFLGEPFIALLVGVLLALLLLMRPPYQAFNSWLSESLSKAGVILAIIAAGGMFGAMLEAANIGKSLGSWLKPLHLGVFFPFLVAAVLKTAQGSSTVAVIT
ncbi:MAG: GntP family permease, partial [Bacteroidota bacterium]